MNVSTNTSKNFTYSTQMGNTQFKNDGNLLELFAEDNIGSQANLQLADPDLWLLYSGLQDRTIWITKEIDEDLYKYCQLIYKWNIEDAQKGIKPEDSVKIKIMISSPGGDLLALFCLLDTIKLSKIPVITCNLSYSYSAAASLLINGHKGYRYIMPHSTALLHNGSINSGYQTYSEAVAQNESYKKMINALQDNILENTEIPKATLTKKLKAGDWYLTAEEQIKYSLADHILTDISELFN